MSNPWEPLPFPVQADADFNATYAGVGAALSQWESIEFSLARLYSVFVGDPDGNSLRGYGKATIFRERLVILSEAADSFFRRNCNQATEGEFQDILNTSKLFSERRNEIAHSIVMDVSKIKYFQNRISFIVPTEKQFVSIPPWHKLSQHDGNGLPNFAYNSLQLLLMAKSFIDFENRIDVFRLCLLQPLKRPMP